MKILIGWKSWYENVLKNGTVCHHHPQKLLDRLRRHLNKNEVYELNFSVWYQDT